MKYNTCEKCGKYGAGLLVNGKCAKCRTIKMTVDELLKKIADEVYEDICVYDPIPSDRESVKRLIEEIIAKCGFELVQKKDNTEEKSTK
jgi:hypothetical protein